MESIQIIFENQTRHSSFGAWPFVRGIKFSGHIFGGGGDDKVYNFSDFWGMVSCYLFNGNTTIHRSHFSNDEWETICKYAESYCSKFNTCKLIKNDK